MAGVFVEPRCTTQQYGENRTSSSPIGIEQGSTTTVLVDQEPLPAVESRLSSAPICRQFWKAGNYDCTQSSKSNLASTGRLSVHPKFLHSNATSHKWPLGAIAELVDNVVDEVQNGATFGVLDKILNPRDGSPALLIQDNGGGMDLEAMLHCLSFGFSDKNPNISIGQYGNGFKTSTMRLGSDVIVFSCHIKNGKKTRSIGLLSYTFLMQTGHDQIVVPLLGYKLNAETNKWTSLNSAQHNSSNLSLILQWSPYSSEEILLNQFDDMGGRGTKIVIYNLWHSNKGKLELDFETDPLDICVAGGRERNAATEQHLGTRFRTSLRAYLSLLYLNIPENFSILLRGQQITNYKIANDLKFPECIVYKPHDGSIGYPKIKVYTTIGFLKEAPHVNVHGFNIYHKNRLILPFWFKGSTRVRGRGVVGVLEANFIQPTHNKQDFEKTRAFQKLEDRLKQMMYEYWDLHCDLLGYHTAKLKRRNTTSKAQTDTLKSPVVCQPDKTSRDLPASSSTESLQDKEAQYETCGAESVPKNMLPNDSNIGNIRCTEDYISVVKKMAPIEADVTKSNHDVQPAENAVNESNDEHISEAPEDNNQLKEHVAKKRKTTPSKAGSDSSKSRVACQPDSTSIELSASSRTQSAMEKEAPVKRKEHCNVSEPEPIKKKAANEATLTKRDHTEPELMNKKASSTKKTVTKFNDDVQPTDKAVNELNDERVKALKENKRLKEKCSKHEATIERLTSWVALIKSEIEDAREEYDRLLAESKKLEQSL